MKGGGGEYLKAKRDFCHNTRLEEILPLEWAIFNTVHNLITFSIFFTNKNTLWAPLPIITKIKIVLFDSFSNFRITSIVVMSEDLKKSMKPEIYI